jgi:hypothetical protein
VPDLRVIGFGKLTCPNGEIAMKKSGNGNPAMTALQSSRC